MNHCVSCDQNLDRSEIVDHVETYHVGPRPSDSLYYITCGSCAYRVSDERALLMIEHCKRTKHDASETSTDWTIYMNLESTRVKELISSGLDLLNDGLRTKKANADDADNQSLNDARLENCEEEPMEQSISQFPPPLNHQADGSGGTIPTKQSTKDTGKGSESVNVNSATAQEPEVSSTINPGEIFMGSAAIQIRKNGNHSQLQEAEAAKLSKSDRVNNESGTWDPPSLEDLAVLEKELFGPTTKGQNVNLESKGATNPLSASANELEQSVCLVIGTEASKSAGPSSEPRQPRGEEEREIHHEENGKSSNNVSCINLDETQSEAHNSKESEPVMEKRKTNRTLSPLFHSSYRPNYGCNVASAGGMDGLDRMGSRLIRIARKSFRGPRPKSPPTPHSLLSQLKAMAPPMKVLRLRQRRRGAIPLGALEETENEQTQGAKHVEAIEAGSRTTTGIKATLYPPVYSISESRNRQDTEIERNMGKTQGLSDEAELTEVLPVPPPNSNDCIKTEDTTEANSEESSREEVSTPPLDSGDENLLFPSGTTKKKFEVFYDDRNLMKRTTSRRIYDTFDLFCQICTKYHLRCDGMHQFRERAVRHVLSHCDLAFFECGSCKFQSPWKYSVKRHIKGKSDCTDFVSIETAEKSESLLSQVKTAYPSIEWDEEVRGRSVAGIQF